MGVPLASLHRTPKDCITTRLRALLTVVVSFLFFQVSIDPRSHISRRPFHPFPSPPPPPPSGYFTSPSTASARLPPPFPAGASVTRIRVNSARGRRRRRDCVYVLPDPKEEGGRGEFVPLRSPLPTPFSPFFPPFFREPLPRSSALPSNLKPLFRELGRGRIADEEMFVSLPLLPTSTAHESTLLLHLFQKC